MARSCLAGACLLASLLWAPPETLARWIDVPYARLGDLCHPHKLAETIKAHRGVTYEEAR